MAECPQVNVPQVDNTPLECPVYYNPACIIVAEANTFIGTPTNTPLSTYLEAVNIKMKKQQLLINKLYQMVENLNEE